MNSYNKYCNSEKDCDQLLDMYREQFENLKKKIDIIKNYSKFLRNKKMNEKRNTNKKYEDELDRHHVEERKRIFFERMKLEKNIEDFLEKERIEANTRKSNDKTNSNTRKSNGGKTKKIISRSIKNNLKIKNL